MIGWNYYPDTRPPVGEPIVVWFGCAVCQARYERQDGKWCWWVTHYKETLKDGWTTELIEEDMVSWWSVQNPPV
jgi:hypothetical protein